MSKKKPAPAKAGLRKRFMVRCSPEQWERWSAEAERRGFARGSDSGVGRLVGHVMDLVVMNDQDADRRDARRKAEMLHTPTEVTP